MGYYIETDSNKGKAQWLRENAKATNDYESGRIPIVVLDNGAFEAAGIAFNRREFEVFIRPSGRRFEVVYVPREEVIKLCPFVEDRLEW